jgi:hypothetical protein
MMHRFVFLGMIATLVTLATAPALAADQCSGHQLLPKPRPQASCLTVTPQVFVSPDRALRATVLPVDISLYATPDMESRIVIRSRDGNTLTSMDHSSPRGTNGYYVFNAAWSPDSQYFVYSLTSSGGHSPWSFPIMVYDNKSRSIAKFTDMIGGRPTLLGQFKFTSPHTLLATTWRKPGAIEDKVAISVDLDRAFAKMKSSH